MKSKILDIPTSVLKTLSEFKRDIITLKREKKVIEGTLCQHFPIAVIFLLFLSDFCLKNIIYKQAIKNMHFCLKRA